MTEIAYLGFDLLIERSEEGYTVQVVDCPAGKASADLCLPFSELELENFVLRMGRTRRGMRRLESSEMEGAKEFGGRLFDAVFQGEVRGCLRSSLDEAHRTGSGLRIRLRLDAPELADVPWEYLYNPSLNRFLALSAETPVVRYLDLPERIQPLTIKPPLQVLVMISNPGGRLALDVEGEWRVLKEAAADLERQGRVTLERLRRGDGRIVHSACSPEGCGLYIMESDGSGVQRLTQGEHDTAPAPSPDGSQVAFMSDQDGNWEIYVVGTDAEGEKPKRLTHDGARDGLPTWSPDGRWLAFVTKRDGRWSVWAMRPDGSDPQELFELGGPLEGKIAFVPDDQQMGWTWETIVWEP